MHRIAYIENLRALYGNQNVPIFDINDGGLLAEILFVLEAPGPKVQETGVISCDNPDGTAKNMKLLLYNCGFDRKKILLWNIVPQIICIDGKNKTPSASQIHQGIHHLIELIEIMPNIRAVVLVGKKAQKAFKNLPMGAIRIFKVHHPSPQHINRKSENFLNLQNEFLDIKQHLESSLR